MRQPFANRSFWWMTLFTVAAMALTAALGQWQLRRAAQKEALAATVVTRSALPALDWTELQQASASGDWSSLHGRRVYLRGQWMNEATVFLENRPLKGQAGFWLITPLRPLAAQATPVLVVRGWVPRRFDNRTAVPDVPASAREVVVEGRMAAAPSKLFELGADTQGRIRQNIDVVAFAQEWSIALPPVSVWQTDARDLPAGWSRDWPAANDDVHKHYGYAFQWFGLCLLMAVLYVWFQFIAPGRRA